jgi:HlyD family secretion protein
MFDRLVFRASMRKLIPLLVVAAAIGGGAYYYTHRRPAPLVLTGLVTTDDVVVAPQIGGQLARLLVKEGDTVARDQLIGVIAPDELRADVQYYDYTAQGLGSQIAESAAAVRFQQQQTTDQITQAQANLDAAIAQQKSAEADLEAAKLAYERNQQLVAQDIITKEQFDQLRTTYDAAKAKVAALEKQVEAARSAVALARANQEQVAIRRSQLQANQRQQAAAQAQRTKADVRLGYAELHAPIAGIVDVRAARAGEVVTSGQAVVTLIDPDDLWVRADVEETYIDRVRIGDKLTVRLPSGEERQGTVFYRAEDANFATQRDVSRTKRDIKTFEIRLRVDNHDRRLAVGMTAYVLLPLAG